MDDTGAPPLSAELRARSASAHASAEASPFLVALLAGDVGVDGVAALLGRLLPVHRALEVVGRSWSDDPVVSALLLPGLPGRAALEADLSSLGGRAVRSPAAEAYAARVLARGTDRAGHLAHHYVRTLGDLAGGPLLGRAVERSLGLTLRFFTPDLPLGPTRDHYRSLLDAAPLGAQERERVVQEVLVAYRLNDAVHAELDDPALARR